MLSSCVLHEAYVAPNFEPVVVNQKNDYQVAITLRPFDYFSLDGTYAFANHWAVRTNVGGTSQLFNGMIGAIYFNKIKNNNCFIAPLYNYQNNQIQRRRNGTSGLFGKETTVDYNCVFNSAGFAFGYSIPKARVQHHFIFKPQYNFVSRYNFEYTADNGSGRSSYFQIYDEEVLHKKVPFFFSTEISYAMLFKFKNRNNFFKIQFGLNLCEKTYTHNYSFDNEAYSSKIVDKSTRHPRSYPVFLSTGFIF